MSTAGPADSRWVRELRRNLHLKTQLYLYGNIYDVVPFRQTHLYLRDFLREFLRAEQYEVIGCYDIVDGLSFESEAEAERFRTLAGAAAARAGQQGRDRSRQSVDSAEVLGQIRTALAGTEVPCAFIVDQAALLSGGPEGLPERERGVYLRIAKSAREAGVVRVGERLLNNLLILVTERLGDLPAWLYMHNPLARTLQVDRPGEEERRRYFTARFDRLYQAEAAAGQDRTALVETLVDLSHGMMHRELSSVIELSRQEQMAARQPQKIVERFKFGDVESPWEGLLKVEDKRRRLAEAEVFLSQWVKGQPAAVQAAADILKRAAQGLSGMQHASKRHRPKGVLFFAGPTGTGKTELAKALAALLFGTDSACLRFDMSEYSQSHSDQRLFGAPPGYVGYEEGGQLTNAVKANPFSVLLFDEIEKADPSILDKFLQILDDGRLTSGQGETIYFSECLIIFTSNQGIYRKVAVPGGGSTRVLAVRPSAWHCVACGHYDCTEQMPARCERCGSDGLQAAETPYLEVKERVLSALADYFKLELGRPELYNRLGNNFVVFDFIRPPVMQLIIDKMLNTIAGELRERRHLEVDFDPVRLELCRRAAVNVDLGGRGVGNLIESVLLNPLARQLFDEDVPDGARLVIDAISEDVQDGGSTFRLQWRRL